LIAVSQGLKPIFHWVWTNTVKTYWRPDTSQYYCTWHDIQHMVTFHMSYNDTGVQSQYEHNCTWSPTHTYCKM